MTSTKDSDNRVVVHFSTGLRVWGGFFVLFGGGLTYAFAYGFSQDIDADIVELLWFMLPLSFVFLSIFFLGYTSQFIFDHTLENMTIRTGVGPFTYRIRHFPKRELLTVGVYKETGGTAGYTGGPYGGIPVTLWRVSLGISGRKKDLKIIVNNEKMANYLVDRIRTFL